MIPTLQMITPSPERWCGLPKVTGTVSGQAPAQHPTQVTTSSSPSAQAPVARGLPQLSLPRSICPVLLFCQHHFLGPLLAHPSSGSFPCLPTGRLPYLPTPPALLTFLGCDSCTLVCPQDLGGRGEICIFSGTQSPAQSGL